MGMAFLSTAWFAVACVCIYYVTVEYLHFDKPMKGLCTTTDEMDENLCFFAVGQVRGCCLCHAAVALPTTPYFRAAQYAYGIISMGQFGFGFFNFSQVQCVCVCVRAQDNALCRVLGCQHDLTPLCCGCLQVGIGLITGFGQVQGGLGVTVAQITCSSFVPVRGPVSSLSRLYITHA